MRVMLYIHGVHWKDINLDNRSKRYERVVPVGSSTIDLHNYFNKPVGGQLYKAIFDYEPFYGKNQEMIMRANCTDPRVFVELDTNLLVARKA